MIRIKRRIAIFYIDLNYADQKYEIGISLDLPKDESRGAHITVFNPQGPGFYATLKDGHLEYELGQKWAPSDAVIKEIQTAVRLSLFDLSNFETGGES